MKKIVVLLLALTLVFPLLVGCSSEDSTTPAEDQLKIVASTSWTALIAEAAGAENVTVLAPVEMRHPPEYDFKPSDVQALLEADWIIMAGYEGFMNQMIAANNISEEKIIRITTTNTAAVLIEQTKAIAEKLGTTELQQAWENQLTEAMDNILALATEKEVAETRVLVHMHMQAFVRSLGYNVVGVFSPEDSSPAKMGELAALNPDLIIDNYHNAQGETLGEMTGALRVELRNFPGPEHKSIIELLVDNAKKLGLE